MRGAGDGGYDMEKVGDILDGLKGRRFFDRKRGLIVPSQLRAIFF
jgi:hypothetical protein